MRRLGQVFGHYSQLFANRSHRNSSVEFDLSNPSRGVQTETFQVELEITLYSETFHFVSVPDLYCRIEPEAIPYSKTVPQNIYQSTV